MKTIKIVNGLYLLAALTSCQTTVPELTCWEKSQKATVLSPEKTEGLVWDNTQLSTPAPLTGTSLFYALQFDVNQDKVADAEMNVCIDATHLEPSDIKTYMNFIRSLSDTEQKSFRQWQKEIDNRLILKRKPLETCLFWINDAHENTR